MQHIRKRQQKSIDYFCVYVYVYICYTLKATINCFMLKTFNAFQYCNTVLFSSFKSPIFAYIYTRQSQIFVWSTNKQNEKEKKKQKEGLYVRFLYVCQSFCQVYMVCSIMACFISLDNYCCIFQFYFSFFGLFLQRQCLTVSENPLRSVNKMKKK